MGTVESEAFLAPSFVAALAGTLEGEGAGIGDDEAIEDEDGLTPGELAVAFFFGGAKVEVEVEKLMTLCLSFVLLAPVFFSTKITSSSAAFFFLGLGLGLDLDLDSEEEGGMIESSSSKGSSRSKGKTDPKGRKSGCSGACLWRFFEIGFSLDADSSPTARLT